MKKILCIGSVTTDIIVSPADSIPSPGTMSSVKTVTTHVGGCASNAAIDLAKLGAYPILCCKVGKDNFGSFVVETAKAAGVDVGGVTKDPSVSTTASVVCVNSSGERSMLYNPGSTSAFFAKDIPEQCFADSDIVFVAGALILTAFDGSPCADFLRRAQQAGKYTVMDTAFDLDGIWLPKVKESIQSLDLFMPSYEEAAKISGETEISKIADTFFALGAKNIIIKLGKDGAYICEQNGSRYILPTYASVKPVDTTGAGDSFCAGFLCGLSLGWDYRECGRFANAVGTHCVMEIGASTGIKSISETLQFMEEHPLL
jgi:sugar/nucleoside kinase (ribokinase family)